MCPSYRATGEEEHSTRGRARLLFEMLGGHADSPSPTAGGPPRSGTPSICVWPARDASRTARPASTWPPTRPSSSPTITPGGSALPRTTRWAGCRCGPAVPACPRLVNALDAAPGLRASAKALAGVAAPREARSSPRESFVQWWQARGGDEPDPADPATVVLWPDTFSNYFHPASRGGGAGAGGRRIPRHCADPGGVLRADLDLHRPARHARSGFCAVPLTSCALDAAGTPVVGLEPSLHGGLPRRRARVDARRPGRAAAARNSDLLANCSCGTPPTAGGRRTSAGQRDRADALPPARRDGYDADRELLRRAGVDADVLDEGCCGLAGNFGFERGHHELSMASPSRCAARRARGGPRTPWCSRTGSAAAPRSNRAEPAAVRCIWRRPWPSAWTGICPLTAPNGLYGALGHPPSTPTSAAAGSARV